MNNKSLIFLAAAAIAIGVAVTGRYAEAITGALWGAALYGISYIREKLYPSKMWSDYNKNMVDHQNNDGKDILGSNPINPKTDDEIYEEIANELDNNSFRKALWIKLLDDSDGNESHAKLLYIRQRRKEIKELDISNKLRSAAATSATNFLHLSEACHSYNKMARETLNKEIAHHYTSGACTEFMNKIRRGASVDDIEQMLLGAPILMFCEDSDKNTTIHLAIKDSNIDLTKYLFDLGLNMDKPNKFGSTPNDLIARWR